MSSQEITPDVERVIRAYCHEMDGVNDLRRAIDAGGERSFVSEFAEAVRAGVFTPTLWGQLTRTDLDPDENAQMDADLRHVWTNVAPDQPFPGDE